MERKNWVLISSCVASIMAIALVVAMVVLSCNFRASATNNSAISNRVSVSRSDDMITISHYSHNQLDARLTYSLGENRRRTLRLFRGRYGLGRIEEVLIIRNRDGDAHHLYIDGVIYDCSEERNSQLCDEATQLFRLWEQNLNAAEHLREAIESDINSFDFTPYIPSDGCGP